MKQQLLLFAFLFVSQFALAFDCNNALPPTASITYNSPFCHNLTSLQPVVLSGSGNYLGGTFSATPSGLSVNVGTGDISPALSNPGTYTVTYTVSPTQTDPALTVTTTVQIAPAPQLNAINYTGCMSLILPPLMEGNYYTEPNGGGTMIPAGTEITYTQQLYIYAESGGCVAQADFMVIIFAMIVPIFTELPPICAGGPPPVLPSVSTNGVTGTWSPAVVDNMVPATYTFTPDFQGQFCATTYTLTSTIENCFGINVQAFLDLDANGVQNGGEPNFPLGQFHYEKNNDGISHDILAPNGTADLVNYNASDSYDISYSIDTSVSAQYNIAIPSYSNIMATATPQTYYFPITVGQAYSDLNVTLVPIGSPRAGNGYSDRIVYSNSGNTTIDSGLISYTHDAIVGLIDVSVPGFTPTTNGFTYEFSNLGPFESRWITVSLQVPPIPTVTLNQPITNSVSVTTVGSSDSSTLTQGVIGSWDPNDKTENHGGKIVFAAFTPEDYLYYTIRFENTGNAEAFDVRITDVLDAQLDENTVKLVSASHPYVLEKNGGNLEFVFSNINLSPSVANTDIGKGYVTFKVKPNPGYALGDIIPNMGSIYFDSNPAIETNSFTTEFVTQLGTAAFEASGFSMYPNPASKSLMIRVNEKEEIATIVIYDALGKTILEKHPQGRSELLDIPSIAAGIYFVKVVTTANSESVKKLIIK